MAAFALSEYPITIRNPIRQPAPMHRITIIVIPTYRRFKQVEAIRAHISDDCVWFSRAEEAFLWTDRCIERGIRLDVNWIIRSW